MNADLYLFIGVLLGTVLGIALAMIYLAHGG
jgi:hypothetical protein